MLFICTMNGQDTHAHHRNEAKKALMVLSNYVNNSPGRTPLTAEEQLTSVKGISHQWIEMMTYIQKKDHEPLKDTLIQAANRVIPFLVLERMTDKKYVYLLRKTKYYIMQLHRQNRSVKWLHTTGTGNPAVSSELLKNCDIQIERLQTMMASHLHLITHAVNSECETSKNNIKMKYIELCKYMKDNGIDTAIKNKNMKEFGDKPKSSVGPKARPTVLGPGVAPPVAKVPDLQVPGPGRGPPSSAHFSDFEERFRGILE